MGEIFKGDDSSLSPNACEFWQMNRIPQSPLRPKYPQTRFLRWLHTDSQDNYNRRGNKKLSESSVGYEFNSLGYRGSEFSCEPGEVGVMFVGDSNTLGIGTPWEALWTSLVTKYLAHTWGMPVRQFNLAWGGTGSDYVSMIVHQSVEVLAPRAVFVLWSFIGRLTWFAEAHRQVHFIPGWVPDPYATEHSAFLRLTTGSQAFFNYVRNFHLVNDRLSRLGIPYYWGSLEPFSEAVLSPYLPLDGYTGRWTQLDAARDGRHGGLDTHASFAESVISAIERKMGSGTLKSVQRP